MTQQKAEAMEHGELIARLEAASEGSRELDRELMLLVGDAREVDHCTFYGPDERVWCFGDYERETDLPPLPYLTSSLDAIVALIERKLPGHMVEMGKYTDADEGPAGSFGRVSTYCHGDGPRWEGEDRGVAPTLPLALCIAFLRALRTQDQGDQTNGR